MSSKAALSKQVEVHQTSTTDNWHPDPSKSLPLSKERQALLDDIVALCSCQPTVARVKRYTPDCVYGDQDVPKILSSLVIHSNVLGLYMPLTGMLSNRP